MGSEKGGENGEFIFLEQYPIKVVDYSSQYGPLNGGISYTANNIIGPPSRFPAYGDFPETYAPRTYGHWWKKSPSTPLRFSSEDVEFEGQDFIDVQYHTPVYPFCIRIYETYQAGCVRRVWAGDGHGNWKCLSQKPRQKSVQHSQMYLVTPGHIEFLTCILRIEIDQYLANYYPEIDAVLLVGTKEFPSVEQSLKKNIHGLSQKICGLGLHNLVADFNILTNIRLLGAASSVDPLIENSSNFARLPEEILRHILKFLDIRSLCSISRVSVLFNQACRDPLLYTSSNLKPYWNCVNRSALEWLGSRCHLLNFLDMSWCGAYGRLDASDFSWFIKGVGKYLRILRLENCSFLNNEAMYWISVTCTSLQELNLRGCRQLEPTAFWNLGRLRMITRLVLDCTQIELPALLLNLQSMTSIVHLSIASCERLSIGGSLDEIVRWLNRHRPKLQSLDMWRSGHFSQSGTEMLVGLTCLRELDIGWCGLPPGYWISQLAKNCRSIQKLFLTAARVVSDTDLISISQCCLQLQQLDILGNDYVTPTGCSRVLQACHRLELLDVSYCGQIGHFHVKSWSDQYPRVSIKYIS